MLAGFLILLNFLLVRDKPLPPMWSPDHQVLASTEVPINFVTPEGGNYHALLNGQVVYPVKPKKRGGLYSNWHTFLSDFAWSPDSQNVAFVEKVYDWQYYDPFGRYWDGQTYGKHFFLAILSRNGRTTGYPIAPLSGDIQLHWKGAGDIVLNGQTFDLNSKPPQPIP
jgi:hypothetical protein